MNELVTCRNLTKRYGSKFALNNVSLSIESGKIVGLLGPNGSGKTTLIKILNQLITPTSGEVLIGGSPLTVETKAKISYLPDRMCLGNWMHVADAINFFADFYTDFDRSRAQDMLDKLHIRPSDTIRAMSKGTKEKLQLILVMSRRASLYCLDEPIAGVDPAARDYILSTILNNYDPDATILISTHLISDVENILDEVIFIREGSILLQSSVDDLRIQNGKSVDHVFREVFKC